MHTVFLEGVPVLDLSALNQVRRLIVLVDTLYDIWYFKTRDVEYSVPRDRIVLSERITPSRKAITVGYDSRVVVYKGDGYVQYPTPE